MKRNVIEQLNDCHQELVDFLETSWIDFKRINCNQEETKRSGKWSASSLSACSYRLNLDPPEFQGVDYGFTEADKGTAYHRYLEWIYSRDPDAILEQHMEARIGEFILRGSCDMMHPSKKSEKTFVIDFKSSYRDKILEKIANQIYQRQIAIYTILKCACDLDKKLGMQETCAWIVREGEDCPLADYCPEEFVEKLRIECKKCIGAIYFVTKDKHNRKNKDFYLYEVKNLQKLINEILDDLINPPKVPPKKGNYSGDGFVHKEACYWCMYNCPNKSNFSR